MMCALTSFMVAELVPSHADISSQLPGAEVHWVHFSGHNSVFRVCVFLSRLLERNSCRCRKPLVNLGPPLD